MSSPHKLAVFVSGEGSLLQFLAENQNGHGFEVAVVVTSRASAPAVKRAGSLGLSVLAFDAATVNELIDELSQRGVSLIVLAGFLKKIPDSLVRAFNGRMINTHPSLLPKYGGKGMYGLNVHKAVLEAGDSETGCTTHFVTENYDEGEIILQRKVKVVKNESPESLQQRVKLAEQENLLQTLKKVFQGRPVD